MFFFFFHMVVQPPRKGVSTLFYKHEFFFQVEGFLSAEPIWVSFVATYYSQVDDNIALSYITADIFSLLK